MPTQTDVQWKVGWSLRTGRWILFSENGDTIPLENHEDPLEMCKALELEQARNEAVADAMLMHHGDGADRTETVEVARD